MKVRILALAGMWAMVGCGATSQPDPEPVIETVAEQPSGLSGIVPDDTLRAACPGHSDPLLQALIDTYDMIRDTGYSEIEFTSVVIDVCVADPDPQECFICMSSLVDLVYGRDV